MIIEARTITNVAEMLEFCLAAVAQMRVAEITLKDGSRAYDVLIAERRLNRHTHTKTSAGVLAPQ